MTAATGHEHVWSYTAADSDIHVARYACPCGARGWRRRAERGKPWTQGRPIVEYADPATVQRRDDVLLPPVHDAAPRANGTNKTGGYLPPGTATRRST